MMILCFMFLRKAGISYEAELKDYGMLTILNRHWNDTIADSFFFALYIGCIALKSLSWFACITLIGKVHWAKFIFPPFCLYSASVVLFCTTLLAASVNKESATFLAHCSARADHRDRFEKRRFKSIRPFGVNLGYTSVIRKPYLLASLHVVTNITMTLLVTVSRGSAEF